MSLEVFQACVAGYSDRIFDQQLLCLQTGHWAGYYSNPKIKRPKPLKQVMKLFLKDREEATKKARSSTVRKPDVRVATFLETERQFNERAKKQTPIKNTIK